MRILLIGNASSPVEIKPEEYDEIVVFNNVANREWLKRATAHWTRAIGKDLRPVAGEPLFPEHSCKIVICDAINQYGRDLAATLRAQGRQVVETRVSAEIPPGYPVGKCASTGYAALHHYLRRGDQVTIANFTWQGAIGHAWDHEEAACKNLIRTGRITQLSSQPKRRLAHFVWIDMDIDGRIRDLDMPKFFSLYSFLIHHPHWDVRLWTNVTWRGQLTARVLGVGLQIERISLASMPFKATMHNAHYPDYWRYKVLFEQGGMYSDVDDTVTIGNFDAIYDAATTLTWCKSATRNDFRSGWLVVNRPGDRFARQGMDFFTSPGYRQDIRAGVERQFDAMIGKELSPGLNYSVVYPVHWEYIRKVCERGTIHPSLFPDTRQVHFYAAGRASTWKFSIADFIQQITAENWRTVRNVYAQTFRLSLARAGDPWLYETQEPARGQCDHAVVISLRSSKDRLTRFRARETAAGIPPARHFEAFGPIPGHLNVPGRLQERHAASGCLLSHLAALRLAKAMSWPQVLIWEDDAVFKADFAQSLATVVKSLPADWDVLMLGNLKVDGAVSVSSLAAWAKKSIGTQSMLVSAKTYDALIDLYETYANPVDLLISDAHALTIYRATPGFVDQEEGTSTIDGKFYQHQAAPATAETVFSNIIRDGRWTNVCGPGSHPDACRPYWKEFLPAFFKDNQIRSVLDWGCGDWQHSQFIDWTGIDYLGVDIVREFIGQNSSQFLRPGVKFSHVDDFKFGSRQFDLMIVKEVFIHWPNQAVKDFLDSIKGIRMLLIVNSVDVKTNTDISFGEFRSFDPSKPPFNLPVDKVFSYRFAGHEYAVFKLLLEIPVQPVEDPLLMANC